MRQGHRSFKNFVILLTALHGHPFLAFITGIFGLRADEAVAIKVLQDVRCPACCARNGEDGCEQVCRDAEAVVNCGGVEIDVSVEVNKGQYLVRG